MIKTHATLPLILASGLLLAGCSKSAPECSDDQTKDLVLEIASNELVRQSGQEVRDLHTLSLSAIRTTDFKESTGAQTCAAELAITRIDDGKSSSLSITYTVELADDGDQIYVNVFGL